MSRLQGKLALVTGAGQGIGRGIALAMAREGADLALVESNEATATTTGEEIRALGVRADVIVADVGSRAACESALARAVGFLGGLDVLVNNAGWAKSPVSLLETDDTQFERTWQVNTMATFWLMQGAHPHLVARGGGSIVNFASASGTSGRPGDGAYATAKEGVRGLSRVAANEWGPDGIRVNVVCPFANSPGLVAWSKSDPRGYEAAIRHVPLRRVGDCEDDIGRVVVFLASDDASYVTGQTLMVDGGSGTFR